MDDFLVLGVLLLLVLLGGWLLGVMAFFKVRSVRSEIAALRQSLQAKVEAAEAPMLVQTPPSMPFVAPPVVEPPPLIASESVAEPVAASEPVAKPPRPDIEALLTARWGVWLGAAALVLAGVFLIRYAVDEGMLGPAPRCILAGLLGLALITMAEWLRRHEILRPGLSDQAAPGLAAGGVAVLFGAAYGAGVLYALMPPLMGFVLLAAASFIGLAISLRHGQLVAAVGILGAFVTPALVITDNASLVGLFIYLLLVTACALGVVRYTAWIWLGWATTIAGAVWVLLATLAGQDPELWAAALFVPSAAALNLVLLPTEALDHPIGKRLAWVPCAALGATGLLLASLDQGWADRVGVLLFVPLTIWRATREDRLRLLPYLAALLFLLLLAGWSVEIHDWPDITVPPDRWTPAVVQELLDTAAFIAGCFAAAGVWFERRAIHPLPWSSLTASVPVLGLTVCYGRVAQFHPQLGWAVFALLLAAGLTALTAAALREELRDRAGVHASGVAAALALGLAMLLRDHWLTMALSLFLPALAWVAAQVTLPALRQVALAVAVVVLARLLLNGYVLQYDLGQMPIANGLIAAYAVPAAAFALTAAMFRRQADDMAVGVLEAGSVALATVFVALEIRHGFGGPDGLASAGYGFREAALDVTSVSVLTVATMQIALRLNRPVLHWAWRVQGTAALVGGVLLIIASPLSTDEPVGRIAFFDWLLPAYLLPALLAVLAYRSAATAQPPALRSVLGGYALIAGFAWLSMEVRHLFHAEQIGFDTALIEDAELWAWSGAWLAYGVGVMGIGIAAGNKRVRLAALTIVGLTTAKVFLVDMAGLVGLWRVLSFLGLGLVLIGLGAVYRRMVVSPTERQA